MAQISFVLEETYRGEIFWLCASINMAIYVIEIKMTKFEVDGTLATFQPGGSQLSVRMTLSQNERLNKVPLIL